MICPIDNNVYYFLHFTTAFKFLDFFLKKVHFRLYNMKFVHHEQSKNVMRYYSIAHPSSEGLYEKHIWIFGHHDVVIVLKYQ